MAVQTAILIPNISAVSATSEAANFPRARMLSLDPAIQPWRSTSRAQQDLIFYLGIDYDTVLTNPNVETDLVGWNVTDAARVTRDVTDVPLGFTACIRIDDNSASVMQNANTSYRTGEDLSGKTFQLQFWGKKNSGANMNVLIRFLNLVSVTLAQYTQEITGAAWQSYTVSGVAPVGTMVIQVFFQSDTASIGISRATGFVLRTGWQAMAILHPNFGNCEVNAADNVTITSGVVVLTGSPFTMSIDKWEGHIKHWIAQEIFLPYVRIRIITTIPTLKNVSYYQIGAVVFSDRVSTFTTGIPHGGQPLIGARRTVEKPLYTINAGGREEVAAAGPFGITDEWEGRFSPSLIDEWRDVGLLGPETPFLVYDNLGSSAEVYLMRYRDSISWTRNNSHFDSNLRLQQII